jgi:capsule biosynthesis phosphatase
VKRLVMDLDGTITQDNAARSYADKEPNLAVIEQMRSYKDNGFTIVIHSARNMRTYNGSIGKINVHTLPVILAWLDRHSVPYDEVVVGKPWCGTEGFYVDDRAIRPSEFASLSLEEIRVLIGDGAKAPSADAKAP